MNGCPDRYADEREAAARRDLERRGWETVDVSPHWKRAARGGWRIAGESWNELLAAAIRCARRDAAAGER